MPAPDDASQPLGAPYPLKRRFRHRVLPVLLLFIAALVLSAGYAAREVVEGIYLQLATRNAAGIAAGVESRAPAAWRRMLVGPPLDAAGRAELTDAFLEEVREFRLSRLKVYDLKGLTIFDTDRSRIGGVERNPALAAVADSDEAQVVSERGSEGGRVYELYVPYRHGGRLVAIFELYEPVGFLDAILVRAGLVAALVPAGLLVVLAAALAALVGRAQADIDRRTGAIDALRRRLASLVSRRAADLMQSDAAGAPTARRTVSTLLFTDIRGFTGFAEREPPERVIAALDRALGLQVGLVERWGGDVDKMMGDGMFARFDGRRAARRAIGCALAIQRDARRAALPLGLGVGVYSGPVVIGVMGGGARRDVSTVGDSVNVAARLCAQAEAGEIVADAATAAASGLLAAAAPARVALRGRRAPIDVVRTGGGGAVRRPASP